MARARHIEQDKTECRATHGAGHDADQGKRKSKTRHRAGQYTGQDNTQDRTIYGKDMT